MLLRWEERTKQRERERDRERKIKRKEREEKEKSREGCKHNVSNLWRSLMQKLWEKIALGTK